jgi:signal transduction histidine kinase
VGWCWEWANRRAYVFSRCVQPVECAANPTRRVRLEPLRRGPQKRRLRDMHRRHRRRTSAERWAQVTAIVALTAFVVGVYVVVVLGVGALIGSTDSPRVSLSVFATAIVALGFEPVRRWTTRVATGLFHSSGFSPYDVLSHFSETVTGGYATDDIPDRMVRLLVDGTHAKWGELWLMVQGRLVLAARWPAAAADADDAPVPAADGGARSGDGRREMTVRHGGQVYGVFRLQERAGLPLSSVEERLFTGLAAQAGQVLRLVGLRADLTARRSELESRTVELQASRERLIAAQDGERRRLERDIHDGAQQHLVALAVNLRLVETVAAKDPERAARLLARQADAARAATETLSRLAGGMYPKHLADAGLGPALQSAVAASPVPVVVIDELPRRQPEPVETALYFFAMEAVQNAAKHAAASSIRVELTGDADLAQVVVVDDGTGFAMTSADPAGGGRGLANMHDRIDAVGGIVTVDSAPGHGTRVTAGVPVLVTAAVVA